MGLTNLVIIESCYLIAWWSVCRLQLKCDGTRWRTGGEVKGKLTNGVGSQYPSHCLGTWCIQHYYRWCAQLGCQQSTDWRPPADLNGLVRFAERQSGFCACAITFQLVSSTSSRAQLKCGGTRWRTGGQGKGKQGKLAIGMSNQYPSDYLGTWCIHH